MQADRKQLSKTFKRFLKPFKRIAKIIKRFPQVIKLFSKPFEWMHKNVDKTFKSIETLLMVGRFNETFSFKGRNEQHSNVKRTLSAY